MESCPVILSGGTVELICCIASAEVLVICRKNVEKFTYKANTINGQTRL
jgi:hypothetical protein